MQKITPFLWFDGQAEEAMSFYVSVFRTAKAGKVTRYGETGPGKPGSVMTASFELEGLEFTALNGGPQYQFGPAISFFVACEDQAEVDEYWAKLLDGGKEMACGWITDKYGMSWQITPKALLEMLQDPDPAKANRVMQAMLQMVKIDLAALRQAYAG